MSDRFLELESDILKEVIKNLAVAVVLQAAQDAKAGSVEAAYWLSCQDVQDTWCAVAGLSWSHVQRFVQGKL